MSDIFSNASDREALVNDVAAQRGVAAWVIEKDLWVCWTLARLREIDGLPQLTFKGGTSLSKVHQLIDRFSEDIDLTFSRDGWGFDNERDPLHSELSGKKREKLVDEISERSAAVVRDVVVPGLRNASSRLLGESGWTVEIDSGDAQAVLFAYPGPTVGHGYGRPTVMIEFGARGDPWPTSPKTIRPFVEETHKGTAESAIVEINTLDPERTFWEKVTLLHALHHATLKKPDKKVHRLSRHIYDVHRLWEAPELKPRIQNASLLLRVVQHKQVFFKENPANYDLVTKFDLNCAPHPELLAALRDDFNAMESMFFPGSKVPAFDEAVATLKEIELAVAAWKTS